MYKMKVLLFVCIFGAQLLSICSAQVAKSQPISSSTSENKSSSARSYTTTDPNYVNTIFSPGRIDLFQLLPILLVLAFIPIFLPLLTQLVAGLFTPLNFTHGRRRRDANLHKMPQISDLVMDIMRKVEQSIEKYTE